MCIIGLQVGRLYRDETTLVQAVRRSETKTRLKFRQMTTATSELRLEARLAEIVSLLVSAVEGGPQRTGSIQRLPKRPNLLYIIEEHSSSLEEPCMWWTVW